VSIEASEPATRFFERFDSAARLLGADAAAVRTAGVVALAHLADTYPSERALCVDALCSYLRQPPVGWSLEEPGIERGEDAVRNAVVDEIRKRISGAEPTWARHPLDLSGAIFGSRAVFAGGTVSASSGFEGAVFTGRADFTEATFNGCGDFANVQFLGDADFGDAAMRTGHFTGSVFGGAASFARFRVKGALTFQRVRFARGGDFRQSDLGGHAIFDSSRWDAEASFAYARLRDLASFNFSEFADAACFESATFDAYCDFQQMVIRGRAAFRYANFVQNVSFAGTTFENEPSRGDSPNATPGLAPTSQLPMPPGRMRSGGIAAWERATQLVAAG